MCTLWSEHGAILGSLCSRGKGGNGKKTHYAAGNHHAGTWAIIKVLGHQYRCLVGWLSPGNKTFLGVASRVETSTEFATRVPDTHYPTGTRVLVIVNLVSD